MPRARFLATAAGALTLALGLVAAPAQGSGGVLVVGDSLEVLTSPYLQRHLPGVALTVDAEGGYNSNQIRELFEESYDPSQSAIVFDAGTNDNPAYPQILAENLATVAARIGDRCMVVPTIHGFTVNGVDNTGKNEVVRAFAASRPGTQVPDWAGAIAAHPELLQSDGLHPTPEGAGFRARLIARGVETCLAYGAPPAHEAALESAPELEPVSKLARREAALGRAVGIELARRAAATLVRDATPLAAVLTMVSSYA
jgi:lysophospholipase L1-like esterase